MNGWRSTSVSNDHLAHGLVAKVRQFASQSVQARRLLQQPVDGIALMVDDQKLTLPAAFRLMLMFEQVRKEHLGAL